MVDPSLRLQAQMGTSHHSMSLFIEGWDLAGWHPPYKLATRLATKLSLYRTAAYRVYPYRHWCRSIRQVLFPDYTEFQFAGRLGGGTGSGSLGTRQEDMLSIDV